LNNSIGIEQTIGNQIAYQINQPTTFTADNGDTIQYTPPSADQTPLTMSAIAGTDVAPMDITPTVFDPSELEQTPLPDLSGYGDAANGPTVSTPIPDMTPAELETVTVTASSVPAASGQYAQVATDWMSEPLNYRMGMSTNGIEFLKGVELYKDHIYTDATGNPTFGYGHKLTPDDAWIAGALPSMSDEEKFMLADSLFYSDLNTAENTVTNTLGVTTVSSLAQNQYDALRRRL
jgi:hypothetical protein